MIILIRYGKNRIKLCLKILLIPLSAWAIRFIQRYPVIKSHILNLMRQYPRLRIILLKLAQKPGINQLTSQTRKFEFCPSSKLLTASGRYIYQHLRANVEGISKSSSQEYINANCHRYAGCSNGKPV